MCCGILVLVGNKTEPGKKTFIPILVSPLNLQSTAVVGYYRILVSRYLRPHCMSSRLC